MDEEIGWQKGKYGHEGEKKNEYLKLEICAGEI